MRRFCQFSLLLLVIVSSLLIIVPAFLIRPFVSQTAQGLAISYALKMASPLLTLFLLLLGVLLSNLLWRSSKGRFGRLAIVMAVIALGLMAILSHQNHFEWMFNPLKHPGFVPAAQATHVKDSDMVLSVLISGEARAYPVRILAYHHIVNDVVGGIPIAVTF